MLPTVGKEGGFRVKGGRGVELTRADPAFIYTSGGTLSPHRRKKRSEARMGRKKRAEQSRADQTAASTRGAVNSWALTACECQRAAIARTGGPAGRASTHGRHDGTGARLRPSGCPCGGRLRTCAPAWLLAPHGEIVRACVPSWTHAPLVQPAACTFRVPVMHLATPRSRAAKS